MISAILTIFSILLIVYYVLYLLRVPSNKWTELLRSVVDPVLNLTRQLMQKLLPALTGKGIDWSPVVLYVAIRLACVVLGLLSGLPLIGWIF